MSKFERIWEATGMVIFTASFFGFIVWAVINLG